MVLNVIWFDVIEYTRQHSPGRGQTPPGCYIADDVTQCNNIAYCDTICQCIAPTKNSQSVGSTVSTLASLTIRNPTTIGTIDNVCILVLAFPNIITDATAQTIAAVKNLFLNFIVI